ncbi:MAG: neutral/alkaline non-lysosomal ceramidase N-terminal domain-containing protein, partial [Nitrososphaerales archaeon]
MDGLHAGAAAADITPHDAQFLFGYPYVHRYATGVNDRLYSSALYLADGQTAVVFIANDIIFVTRQITQRVRDAIFAATGIPGSNVVVTATHTHSAPKTVDYLSNADDSCVPPVDPAYLAFFESKVSEAAVAAIRNARPARAGLVVADAKGVGTNRRDPQDPADPEAPALVVKARDSDETIAVMLVYSMHPTVLREDSSVVSADFPGMARRYLQQSVFHADIPVLHHTGPAGNQSPRHVISGTTVAEAERLGGMLGRAVERALPGITYHDALPIACAQSFIDLPTRGMPPIEHAERMLAETAAR